MGDGGLIIFLVMTILAGVALMMTAMNNRRKVLSWNTGNDWP